MPKVFKRAKLDGSYAWFIRYHDPSGKDIRRRVPAKTKKEAELYLANVLSRIGNGTYESVLRQKDVRFSEIADDFLQYSKAHKRSWKRDQRSINKLLEFFGDAICEKITRSQVENYIASRKKQQGKSGTSLKPATINRELACLKTIFRRACLDEKIAKNPLAGFRLLREDNKRDRVLTESEYQKLLFAAPKHIRPILITAWETGMRIGEILGLQWNQVNLKKGVIGLAGEQTKTGKSREVPISPVMSGTLEKLKRINGWVYNYKGKHLKDIKTAFKKALKKAEIEDFRFHDLRHCFVTRMRRKGIPDRVIMAITGHQTMECFKRYDTISVSDLKQAVGAQE